MFFTAPSFRSFHVLTLWLCSVFEHLHKQELKKAKDDGIMSAAQLETIVHPNEYFKRSYLLKNMGKQEVKREG